MSADDGALSPGYSLAQTLVLCQRAVPDYHQSVLEILIERLGNLFTVYAGSEHFAPTTKSARQCCLTPSR